MAGGPRFWALGVDSGPRGGAFEGFLDPKIILKKNILVPKGRLRTQGCSIRLPEDFAAGHPLRPRGGVEGEAPDGRFLT